MCAARSGGQRSSEELVELAIRHFELGVSVDELAADRGVDQSTIRRWLGRARREGIVRTLVVPPLSDDESTKLRQDVRYTFELEDVVLVPGREDVFESSDDSPAREALVVTIAQAAAGYLADHLTNRDTLLVPWGRMANYIARQLRAPKPLPGLTVVPMEGVLGVEHDPFEANILASAIASEFGGRSLLLPAPAEVDKAVAEMVEGLPLVHRVLEQYRQATVAVVPLAPPDPVNSTVVRMGLLSGEAVKGLIARGAVGEIASHWWFDNQGNVVDLGAMHAIGLGLHGLAHMVRRREKVIAVVGGTRERVGPLRVALNHKLVNVLITDHVTAEQLLSEG